MTDHIAAVERALVKLSEGVSNLVLRNFDENERAELATAALRDSLPALKAEMEGMRKALEPFARIKPASFYPENGSEGEEYIVLLRGHAGNPAEFTGADLARARAALASATSPAAEKIVDPDFVRAEEVTEADFHPLEELRSFLGLIKDAVEQKIEYIEKTMALPQEKWGQFFVGPSPAATESGETEGFAAASHTYTIPGPYAPMIGSEGQVYPDAPPQPSPERCLRCGGTGKKPAWEDSGRTAAPGTTPCPTCGGTGRDEWKARAELAEKALGEERERCARLAGKPVFGHTGAMIAAAIRAALPPGGAG